MLYEGLEEVCCPAIQASREHFWAAAHGAVATVLQVASVL